MITFNKVRDVIFQVDFNIPKFDLTEEQWFTNPFIFSQTNHRYITNSINNPVFKSTVDWFLSSKFKDIVIDTLYSAPVFASQCSILPEDLRSITNTVCTPVQDRPGHITTLHIDTSSLIAAGMCYLIDNDDPQQSTIFYTDDQYSNPLRMNTGWGHGWLAANMNKSWHEGFNKSNCNRHSILFGLSISTQKTFWKNL